MADYHLRLLTGMSEALGREGIPLLVALYESFASSETSSLVLDLLRRQVATGLIMLTCGSPVQEDRLLREASAAGIPVVTLGMDRPGVPSVNGDNVTGMQDLVRHLVDDRGLRRLCLVRGVVHQPDSMMREQVFREELAERGLPVDEALVVDGDFRQDVSYERLRGLLGARRDVDAIVALNDPSALGALAALADHGLRAPWDIAVSGFDNTQDAALSWPDLTTVDQNLEEQGTQAAELVLRIAAGGAAGSGIVVPSRLVVRSSTRARDETLSHDGLPVRWVDGVPVVDLAEHQERLDHVLKVTGALHERATTQEAARLLSISMAHCRTVDDVLVVLQPWLQRLGVRRCFMALTRPGPAAEQGTGSSAGECDEAVALVLSYRNGTFELPDPGVFPRRTLLPAALRPELHQGVLLLQPLSIAGRDRGYLLYEPSGKSALLADAMRIDVLRAMDSVLSWQDLQEHAANLERLVAQRTIELEGANEELRQLAMRDGLTGIANRSAFQQHLDRGWAEAGSSYREWSLLMIDIDLFKAFNDRYGHLAGDDALRRVSACLARSALRLEDLACRYGGEELAVLLPGTGIQGAVAVARRFRALLAEEAIPHEGSTVALTITASIGAAAVKVVNGARPADLVAAADRALYQAKACGRDRIVVDGQLRADPSAPPHPRSDVLPAPARQ